MANVICTQAKVDFLNGVHAPGDDYKIALYSSTSGLDASTTVYSATNEVVSAGYDAGGKSLSGRTVGTAGTTAYVDFNDPQWTGVTFAVEAGIIYNASKSNKVISILDFGGTFNVSNGKLDIELPAPGANAIVRIA